MAAFNIDNRCCNVSAVCSKKRISTLSFRSSSSSLPLAASLFTDNHLLQNRVLDRLGRNLFNLQNPHVKPFNTVSAADLSVSFLDRVLRLIRQNLLSERRPQIRLANLARNPENFHL